MTMKLCGLVAATLLIGGCVDISTRTHPEDTSVSAVLQGEDCIPIILGFGFGMATIEQAKANARPIEDVASGYSGVRHLTKVRSVEFEEFAFLFFGGRCVVVTGE